MKARKEESVVGLGNGWDRKRPELQRVALEVPAHQQSPQVWDRVALGLRAFPLTEIP
jgi:hypothetical protein